MKNLFGKSSFVIMLLLWLKAKSLQGYWEELQHVLERMKYFEAVPSPRFRTNLIKEDWIRYQAAMVRPHITHQDIHKAFECI